MTQSGLKFSMTLIESAILRSLMSPKAISKSTTQTKLRLKSLIDNRTSSTNSTIMNIRDLKQFLDKTEAKQNNVTKTLNPKEMLEKNVFDVVKPTLTVILTEFEYPPSQSYKQLFWLFPIMRLDIPQDFVIRDKKPRPTTMRLGDIISSWMIAGKGADKRVICRGIPREMKNKAKKTLRSGANALRGVFPNCVEMFLTSYTNTVYCKLFDTHVKFSGIIDHYGDHPADVPLLMEKIIGFIYRAERIQTFARLNPTFVARSLQLFKGTEYAPVQEGDIPMERTEKTDRYIVRIPTVQERDAVVAAVVRGKSEEEDDNTHSSHATAHEFLDALCGICYDLRLCFAEPMHAALQDIVAQIVSDPQALAAKVTAEDDDSEQESSQHDSSDETKGGQLEEQVGGQLEEQVGGQLEEQVGEQLGERVGYDEYDISDPPKQAAKASDSLTVKDSDKKRILAYVTKPSLLVRSFQLDRRIRRDALTHCLAKRLWMIAYYINTIHKEVNVQVPPTDETYNACSSCEEDAMEVNVRVSKMGKVTVSGGCDTTNKSVFVRFMTELDEIFKSDEYNLFT